MHLNFSLSRLFLLFSLFSLVLLNSCSKETSDNGTPSEEEEVSRVSSESEAEAEIVFNGVFDDAIGVNDELGMAGTGIFGRSALGTDPQTPGTERPNACFTVTITHPNGTPFPARVVIDFGAVPCMGPDGHTRRGQIITEYTNRLTHPGAIAVTTFHNFYFDSIKVEGTHRITNTSAHVTTIPPSRQFKVEVIDARLTKPNADFIEWNSTKTITQLEGLLTPDFPRDDVFKIEGHSHGRARRGNLLVAWESAIVQPLIKRFLCRWIVSGRVRTVRLNSTTNTPWVAVLDFGNGHCDSQATITINGVTHQITLR